MVPAEWQSLGQLAAQLVAKRGASGPGPVAISGQGDGPQAQSPRRGRKGNAARDGKPLHRQSQGATVALARAVAIAGEGMAHGSAVG